ncbi:MAG: two-component system, sensor histidine kinase YesM [Epulopiscium sp.]|uniref:HAMP domain-containing protein n=1 Tax=Defluviitalea raffinosedens TaxID=1450156 RepID=A0A7C8HDK5_9FIRM|nr:sensor histidine kinase [Defluviitalea raffinosedens]KAE9631337.1 HAMP domain-containing protein [Defluviitalea raffinosedens]MDK2788135.1 two-component system, sensor histidine kinase YesM [Candidatus Epulonipiscium sp.]HHW67127.1 sensor histidine kinase [Candidatus Epulonipiscium sp.]
MKKINKKYRNSLKNQLLIATITFSIVPFIIFSVIFYYVYSLIIKQYTDTARQSVKTAASNIDYVLNDVEKFSNSIFLNYESSELMRIGNRAELENKLRSYFSSRDDIDGIYVMIHGEFYYAGSEKRNGVNIIPKAVLKNSSGEVVWLPTKERYIKVLSSVIKRNCFSLNRKIVDVNSLEELGYMTIDLDEWVLREIYNGLAEDGSQVFICTADGQMISQSGNMAMDYFYIKAIIDKIFMEGNRSYVEYEENGEDKVAIYSPCNKGKWILVKTILKSDLYADIRKLQKDVMIAGIIFILITTGSAYYFSTAITKPIRDIIKKMKEVEKGDFLVYVDVKGNNEFTELGDKFNRMVSKIKGLMEDVVNSEKQKNELELEVLHAQINPHFLYNTLNTIRWMAQIKGEYSISNAIVALVKLLRISISLGKKMITLEEEIEYVKNYILIQRLRFNQDFLIEYEIEDKYRKVMIPKLILQPIVENALIYCIDDEREEKLHIKIYTYPYEDVLRIVVEDNGKGISPEILENIFKEEKNINKFSTVGLNNVNNRIKLYYGERYGLLIDTKEGIGTKVIIEIPEVY